MHFEFANRRQACRKASAHAALGEGKIARITIRHIADHAGTSFKTVSRVINGQDGVGEALRTRVQESMAELGYRPDRAAQTLRSGRNYAICLLTALTTPEAHDMDEAPDFISAIMAGALAVCRARGYQLIFDTVPPANERGDRLIERLRDLRCDGVILFPPHADKVWLLDQLDALDIPYVRLAPGTQLDRSACYLIDDYAAGREIGKLFLEHGHRNIASISGPTDHIAASRRIDGFRSAFEGVEGITMRAATGTFFFPSGLEWGAEILSADNPPSAIFAANDTMALGVMAAARDLGLALPQQLSIAGFDNIPASRFVRPALTTITQDVRKMGEMATAQLIENISAKEKVENRIWDTPYRLELRQSIAPPPAK